MSLIDSSACKAAHCLIPGLKLTRQMIMRCLHQQSSVEQKTFIYSICTYMFITIFNEKLFVLTRFYCILINHDTVISYISCISWFMMIISLEFKCRDICFAIPKWVSCNERSRWLIALRIVIILPLRQMGVRLGEECFMDHGKCQNSVYFIDIFERNYV